MISRASAKLRGSCGTMTLSRHAFGGTARCGSTVTDISVCSMRIRGASILRGREVFRDRLMHMK